MYETVKTQDGAELSYRTFGDGSETVFLVHGWMASGAVFDDMIEALRSDGLRLVVPDLRGAGKSASVNTGFSIEQYASDVLAIADHVGASRFTLVGHSMGGQIAQYVAATAKERVKGAALVCPVPASGVALPEDATALFRTSAQNRDKQKTILQLACKSLDDAARERLLDTAGAISEACIQGAFDAWTRGGFEDKLSAIEAPVLVLATDDPFLPPAFLRDAIASKIKRAWTVYLPGAGHYPLNEKPQETAAILRAFFAGLF